MSKKQIIKYLSILFLAFSLNSFGQDSLNYYNQKISKLYQSNQKKESEKVFYQKIQYLKKQNNLEENYYAWWDFFMLEPVEERIVYLQKGISSGWRKEKTETEKIAKLHVMINLAYNQKNFGNIYNSIASYEQALFYYDQNHLGKYNIAEYCLKPLANNCTRTGDYDRAEELLIRTLKISNAQENSTERTGSVLNLTIFYRSNLRYTEAINLLLQELKKANLTSYEKALFTSELAVNYLENNILESVLTTVQTSENHLKKVSEKDRNTILLRNAITLGDYYLLKNQYDTALKYYDTALSLSMTIYGKYNRETAKLFVKKAENYEKQNQLKEAQNQLKNALISLLPRFNPINNSTLPEKKDVYPENTFLEIFDLFTEIQSKNHQLQEALQSLDLSFYTAKMLRNTYSTQNAKLTLQADNVARTEKYLNFSYQLYLETQNPQWIENAFQKVEMNKSAVLFDELTDKNKKNKLTDDPLIQRERELQILKADVNAALVLIGSNTLENNREKKENLLIQSEKLSGELHHIQEELAKKYPELTQHFTDETAVNFMKNNDLLKNKTWVEYFVGQQNTYVFSKDKSQNLQLRKIDNAAYQKDLQVYLSYFNTKNTTDISTDFEIFNAISFRLYQILLLPELQNSEAENLLIIPDAQLNFIPFDALITEKSDTSTGMDVKYLILDKSVSYAYSMGILSQNQSIKENSKTHDILVFAPVFKNNHRGFSELNHSIYEAEQINTYWKTDSYMGEKATKQNFIHHISNYEIAHISTHATAETTTQSATMAFYDDTLYLQEIYGYHLPLKLMVISGCETGIGTISNGEGAMSLARGFSYAGVQKLVVSLWEVNDQSTAEIMGNFYKYLSQKESVSQSLRQAKLDYLTNTEIPSFKKTPQYWASFISIENNLASSDKENHLLKWYLLGILAIVLFAGLWGYYKFKTTSPD